MKAHLGEVSTDSRHKEIELLEVFVEKKKSMAQG